MRHRLLLVLLLLAPAACGGEQRVLDPSAPSSGRTVAESGEAWAKESFAAMDAADTCAEVEQVWAERLDPSMLAQPNPLLHCTRRLLQTDHEVTATQEYDAGRWFTSRSAEPAILRDADSVVVVYLSETARETDESYPFPAYGWMVVSDGSGRRLFNVGVHQLAECLRSQETCRMAG